MGLISGLLSAPGAVGGLGRAAREMVEVFAPNATREMELDHAATAAALQQFGAEFALAPQGRFDRFINGLNRMPRPLLALGTPGLFLYAMVDPMGFADRMRGLAEVPEPLWWLLGAIVAFYFGARETHYRRVLRPLPPGPAGGGAAPVPPGPRATNPALQEMLGRGGDR